MVKVVHVVRNQHVDQIIHAHLAPLRVDYLLTEVRPRQSSNVSNRFRPKRFKLSRFDKRVLRSVVVIRCHLALIEHLQGFAGRINPDLDAGEHDRLPVNQVRDRFPRCKPLRVGPLVETSLTQPFQFSFDQSRGHLQGAKVVRVHRRYYIPSFSRAAKFAPLRYNL